VPEPRQLPNGRWKVRYRDPEGRPRSKTCRTKSEARAYLEEVRHAVRQRTWVAPERGRITLAAWSEQYMTTVVHLRPTSVSLYERELVHILARFGRTQLSQLDPLAIQAWLAWSRRSTRGTRLSSTPRLRPACAGASWSGCAAAGWTSCAARWL
jgi:hypothetical protein